MQFQPIRVLNAQESPTEFKRIVSKICDPKTDDVVVVIGPHAYWIRDDRIEIWDFVGFVRECVSSNSTRPL